MKKIIGKILDNSLFKFILVGGCSTGIDFVVYMLLSTKLDITISKGISMIVASIFSYIVNKNFTFNNKDKTNIGYLVRYYIVFAVNFATNLGVNYFVYKISGYKLFAFVLATIMGMAVNYIGQKFFVFVTKSRK